MGINHKSPPHLVSGAFGRLFMKHHRNHIRHSFWEQKIKFIQRRKIMSIWVSHISLPGTLLEPSYSQFLANSQNMTSRKRKMP
jgi:hypothetical protein